MTKGGSVGGPNGLQRLGSLFANYGSALSGNPLYAAMAQQQQQGRAEQEQKQREAQFARALPMMLATGTPETKAFEVNGKSYGTDRAASPLMSRENQMATMLRLGGPGIMSTMAQQAIGQLFPQGFTGTVGKNERALVNGKVVAEGPVDAPEPVRGVTMGNRIVNPITGETIREFRADTKEEESWAPVTKELAVSLGLNPTGSYQRNNKGQIQVITQPKQDAPTETQQKAATLATRMGDALGTAKKVLEDDPSAVGSLLLSATEDIPGIAAVGRKYSNPNAQILRNNLVDAIDAAITMGTGAAYNEEQLIAKRNSLLPQIGEPKKVKQDKFRKLMVEYDAARKAARTAGVDLPDASVFAGIYGIEGGDLDSAAPAFENDPLGIRGR